MKIQKITFQQIGDDRGWLSVAEYGRQIPFLVKRIYYIYGVKDGKRRGYHAHKNLQQIMFCISGSCKVMFTDGLERTDILLDKPYEAVYIKECVLHSRLKESYHRDPPDVFTLGQQKLSLQCRAEGEHQHARKREPYARKQNKRGV